MPKLPPSFYQPPATEIVKDFLGKFLVFNSPKGRIAGEIIDVEAYPAFSDNVSHGNKRTKRTEIMYGRGGHAYVYVIYGIHHQFAVVVNRQDIPEVVFIRAVIPVEGIEIMEDNFGKPVQNIRELTKSPGNLCKSFGIDMSLYGADLAADHIFLEDRGVVIPEERIVSDKRIGIDKQLSGSECKLRYFVI